MKRIIAGFCLIAGFSMGAFAQDGSVKTHRFPLHTISKDVARLQFRNTEYVPSKMMTGDVILVSGKGVNRFSTNRKATPSVAVTTGGTPLWVVSKGVAQFQSKRK
jgi:hypothetical protein